MKNENGFNLIELIVAIAIFGIMATAVTVNLRRGGASGQEVQLQANNIASVLREAQVKAFSGEPYNGAVPTGGYGVHLTECSTPPCSVATFADVNNNFTYDAATEEIEVISLGNGVILESISTGNSLDIIFKPPRPFICFSDQCSGIGEVVVTLADPNGTGDKTITINQVSGRISL